MTASRPLFGLERVWLVADRLWPGFANQLVIEGVGDLDPVRWRAAVDAVLPRWPAARARLRGVSIWTRWVADGAPPVVTEVDGAGWDARGPAPFGSTRLDPDEGPIVEVLLVSGATPRVVLCTHHAAFDGRAAWALAEDLGAALRGEPVRGAAFADLSDMALIGEGPASSEPLADAVTPTGPATTREEASTWARVTVPASGGRVLARALAAFASAVDTLGVTGPLRVSLPVDLRRHHDGLRAAANLTGFARVDPRVSPEASLQHALARRDEGGAVRSAHRLRSTPLAVMGFAGRRAGTATLRTGRAASSATLSTLGRLDPGVLDGAGSAVSACSESRRATPARRCSSRSRDTREASSSAARCRWGSRARGGSTRCSRRWPRTWPRTRGRHSRTRDYPSSPPGGLWTSRTASARAPPSRWEIAPTASSGSARSTAWPTPAASRTASACCWRTCSATKTA